MAVMRRQRLVNSNLITMLGITILVLFMAACAADQKNVQKKDDSNRDTSVSTRQTTPPAQYNKDDEFILTSIPINMDLLVQLSVATCKDGQCPLQVRLKYLNEIVSKVVLNHWQPISRQSHRTIWHSLWDRDGDGDPTTFMIGEAFSEEAITVAIQLVKFKEQKWGVLLRQSIGHEHGKAWFTLYEIHEDLDGHPTHRLTERWEKKEGTGPYSGDVIVTYMNSGIVDRDSDRQNLIYLEGFHNTGDNSRFDRVRINRLHWPRDSKNIIVDSHVAMPALWIGQMCDTIEAARSTLSKFNQVQNSKQGYPCLLDYWVLASERFKGLPKGKAVIAFISTSTQGLRREQLRLKTCMPDLEIHKSETILFKE